MSKLITFGCSFTKYMYPTWADIIALEYDEFDNWGHLGGGNHLMMYSLSECMARGKISSSDTVIIMWTSVGREDRFINGEWSNEGSVYNSSYTDKMIKEFTDPNGYLLTNLGTINAVKLMLDAIGCNYTFLKTCPFSDIDDSDKKLDFELGNLSKDIYEVYSGTLDIIKPSVYEVVFGNEWPKRNDTHPTPLEYYMYLKIIGFELTDKQHQYATEWDSLVMSNDYNFDRNYSRPSRRF
jgi:hypothetical protein